MTVELASPGTYRIVDSVTGRYYVGSAAVLGKRWSQHVYRFKRGDHPNPIMQAIWNKDSSRLSFSAVEQMPGATREMRLAAEQLLLNGVVGVDRQCMNVLAVAGSHQGRKRSQETLQRMSAAHKGRKVSDAAKAKMRAAKIGGRLTAEQRAKIAKANLGGRVNRPKGIINHALRGLSVELLLELRSLRKAGLSWRLLGIRAEMDTSAVRRAVIGLTYQDVA